MNGGMQGPCLPAEDFSFAFPPHPCNAMRLHDWGQSVSQSSVRSNQSLVLVHSFIGLQPSGIVCMCVCVCARTGWLVDARGFSVSIASVCVWCAAGCGN
jgi:hypothetical protein